MPLLSALTLTLEDDRYGLSIPYAPHHLVEDGYAGPSGNLGYETGSNVSATYVVPWKYLKRFCQLMLGDNYSEDNRLNRILPHYYNGVFDDGYFGNLWATSIQSIKGIPGPDPYISDLSGDPVTRPSYPTDYEDTAYQGVYYAYASVTVGYSPLPYMLRNDEDTPSNKEWLRYTTVQRTPKVEFLQVQGGSYYWVDSPVASSPVPVPFPLPIRDQSTDYVVTWHRVPFCITDFDAFIGYANSVDEFLKGHPQCPTNGFDKDRMLLVGVQETLIPHPWDKNYIQIDDDGDDWTSEQLYTYSFFFQDKFNGHNKALRRVPSGAPSGVTLVYNEYSMTGATATGNTNRVIKHANMANLFAAR